MPTAERISPEEARRDVTSGRALLVCAYENDAKCGPIMLEGAIPFSELRAREARHRILGRATRRPS